MTVLAVVFVILAVLVVVALVVFIKKYKLLEAAKKKDKYESATGAANVQVQVEQPSSSGDPGTQTDYRAKSRLGT